MFATIVEKNVLARVVRREARLRNAQLLRAILQPRDLRLAVTSTPRVSPMRRGADGSGIGKENLIADVAPPPLVVIESAYCFVPELEQ